MRNRIERLRLWLLAGAGLLVLVLAVFIGSARYLRRHVVARLPAKLGLNIKSETKDVTLSHTSKGGTVYKLQAKKEDELTDGRIAFLDAQILLYGPKQNRSDKIYGDEFQYDEGAGLLKAIGTVHIDMQAAAPGGDGKKVGSAPDSTKKGEKAADEHGDDNGAKVLHATTSGLVYMEKLSIAATSERVEFQMGAMSGHAIGADYSSDSDVLSLHSDVYVSGITEGRPVVLTAASAEIDNRDHVTFLTHAKYVSQGQTVKAEQATVHTRLDGTLERIEAQGGVRAEEHGARLECAHGDVLLNAKGQPKSALLTGGMAYFSDEPQRQRRGQADRAAIEFDGQAKPQPQHAVFTGSVHMMQRTRTAAAGAEAEREPWSVDELTAAQVDVVLVPAGEGRSQPRDAEATGSAHLTVVNNGSLASAKGTGRTELSADDLKAHFLEPVAGAGGAGKAVNGLRVASTERRPGPEIDTLAGRGHTLLHQVSADGTDQTSVGNMLDAKFRPGGLSSVAAGAGKTREVADVLQSAVQQGHVHLVRKAPAGSWAQHKSIANGAGAAGANGVAGAKSSPKDDLEDATAARAVYDGDADRMTLTGGVRLTENGDVIWANQVALDHKTGDARADGEVKVDYLQDDSAGGPGVGTRKAQSGTNVGAKTARADADEPAHILAERAEFNHATKVGTFYGRPVRLWKGGSQVQAPVIEFGQKRLVALSSGGASGAAEVHTVLASMGGDGQSAASASGGKSAAANSSGTCKAGVGGSAGGGLGVRGAAVGVPATNARPAQVVRIASRQLVYSDLTRQAEFSGGVTVQSADGTMLAREATAFLQGADAAADSSKGGAESADAGGVAIDARIERVVAAGKVEIEQPGLLATGGGLRYTAADGVYLLTGENGVLPKVVDSQGTTTAAAFRFTSGNCSVEALNAAPGDTGAGHRVRTDTTVDGTRKSARGPR